MKDNYIVIQGWMCSELNLKGNDLLVYALIYGFSQDGESKFHGSRRYIAEMFNISLPTVDKALNNLIVRNLIIKTSTTINNVTMNQYAVSLEVVKKLYTPYKESFPNNTNNIIDNNSNIIIKNNYNTVQKPGFLGSAKKEQKPNLYNKCIAIINEFTEDVKLRELLVKYLNMMLDISKEKGTPFYTNNFKGKLKMLSSLPKTDWKDIVQRTLDNGWAGFYKVDRVDNFYNSNRIPDEDIEEYTRLQEEWLDELERDGKQTKF